MVYFAGYFPNSYFFAPKKYVFKSWESDYTPKVGDKINDFRRAASGYKYSNPFIVTDVFGSAEQAIRFAKVPLREPDITRVKVFDYFTANKKDISDTMPEKEKENKMKTSMIDRSAFKFGKVPTSKLTYSIYGLAVIDNNGRAKAMVNDSITDVTGFTFDGFPIYQMPVAIKDLKKGDVVLHNDSYMIVVKNDNDSFIVIDVANGEDKVVRPFKNVFGLNYMTKVVDFFKSMNSNPTDPSGMIGNNFFGNPLMLLAMNKEKMDDDLMMMAMMGMNGQNGMSNGMNFNMMIPFLFMKNKNDDDDDDSSSFKDWMLPLMMMNMYQNQNQSFSQVQDRNPSQTDYSKAIDQIIKGQ